MSTIAYNPLPSVAKFHESKSRIKVAWGPIGTGKTSAGLWEFILDCLESRIPLDGMVVRASYRELRDTTLKTFNDWFSDIGEWRESDSLMRIRLPSAADSSQMLEHVLRFRSLERADDAKKVQSWEGSFVMLDEVAPTFSTTGRASEGIPVEIQEYTFARLRHKYKGVEAHRYTQVIVANPPPPSHWLYTHFLSKDPGDLAKRSGGVTVHFIPRQENEKNLRQDYYKDICDAFHDPDLVRRLVEGEIVATYSGEPVFPECRERVHVTNERLRPVPQVPLVLGFDYGLTPATLVTQITPTGQWRWLTELCNFNCSFDTHLELLRAHMHDHYQGWEYRCWGDPAGAQRAQTDEKTCVQMAQKAGFDIQAGRIDWQSRKEAVKQRLLRRDAVGEPGLYISRAGCGLAAEGMVGAYRYPKSASGEIGTRPIKNNVSHVIDAAQYVATREFSIAPQQLPKEHVVLAFPPRPLDPFRSPARPKKRSSWLSR